MPKTAAITSAQAWGDDAQKWAQEFIKVVEKHNPTIDEGFMIGWFANAIELSCDHRINTGRLIQANGAGETP